MNRFVWVLIVITALFQHSAKATDLATLKKGQRVAGFQVENLYSDRNGKIVGARFVHISTGAPVSYLQLQTVPQVLTWIETPLDSNQGLAHSLEHLMIKGTKGRYLQLMEEMRLDQWGARTSSGLVTYGLSSGSGVDGFFDSFHALLDSIYRPDFADVEVEREFYHFGLSNESASKKKLIEQGTVYDEERAVEGRYTYVDELNKRVLGDQNPLAFDPGGYVDEMRTVNSQDIRQFHKTFYRIGPLTGFVFAFSPEEDASAMLEKIRKELEHFSLPGAAAAVPSNHGPKYPIHPSKDLTPAVFPFPSPNAAAPGFIHFAWRPGNAESGLQLKLLEIFSSALAEGEESVLQELAVDSKTRKLDLGATAVTTGVSLENSPYAPVLVVEVAGVPGNRISAESLDALRQIITDKIREISELPDQSADLLAFNKRIRSYEETLHRSELVWTKNTPGFGAHVAKLDWKWQFDRLAMDSSFVQSVSEEPVWQQVEEELRSGKNIWRDIIERFHLAETPYATATAPSSKLLEQTEKAKQERVEKKTAELMAHYHTADPQVALTKFGEDEDLKTKEIEKLANKVAWPHFTTHPPMTPDDLLQYSQLQINGVPVTASLFDSPPTIDIGLSFDLRRVPRSYHKYFPLFVHCIDSLGLNNNGQTRPYSDIHREIGRLTYAFSTGYEANAMSKRVDFTIRASTTNTEDSRAVFKLISQLIKHNDLSLTNVPRLRDVVTSDIVADDWYLRQDGSTPNAGSSFRYQNDPVYFAVASRPTRAHWNARLKWMLHEPVDAATIHEMNSFAGTLLSLPAGTSREELSQKLDAVKATGVEQELIQYWKKNLLNFPDAGLIEGLRQLTSEVQEDLQAGPQKVIEDLKNLQQIVLNRRALHVDLTLSRPQLAEIEPDLSIFVNDLSSSTEPTPEEESTIVSANSALSPVLSKLRERYHQSLEGPPFFIGLVNPNRLDGSLVFYTAFPSYSDIDRPSLVRVLASKIFSGRGPQGFFMKTSEAGLAYDNGIASDPHWKVVWYTADRVPDIAALLKLINATASTAGGPNDPHMIDHALSRTFTFSRIALSFSDRGKALAQDIRDGDDPATIRRFSQSILELSKQTGLSAELSSAALSSICGVLVREDCKTQHEAGNSVFFFVGSEKVLTSAKQAVPIPQLVLVWPSDYWVQ